jgi:hypothetical protein
LDFSAISGVVTAPQIAIPAVMPFANVTMSGTTS